MRQGRWLFASESVSEGHPDKICDRISDSILDAYLAEDSEARVAVETLVAPHRIVLAGETRSTANIDEARMSEIAREAVRDIGYEQEGFDWRNVNVNVYVHKQSSDISQGVDARGNKDEGAGDQGLMFGYACDETPALMPAPIFYAHKILRLMAEARHRGETPALLPDAKSQIVVVYENGAPVGAQSIVVSTQHKEGFEARETARKYVMAALPENWMCEEENFLVNPTGKFVIGGPVGDSGLTGRKIIVDTYGGAAPHGGGAFSGKDPTKVDRSAAYAARYLAKNVVAAEMASRCTVQLSYAIGVSKPLSLYVDLHGTGKISEDRLECVLGKAMILTPRGIREHLQLNRPIYARTSSYGHFGRPPEEDGGFSWEKTDLAATISDLA